jgi:ceramide glucosyltransferase
VMSDSFIMLLTNALLACAAAGTLYLLVTVAAVRHFLRRRTPPGVERPSVTVLKPLCGDEPELYENLRSFCRQRYPGYQLVFGVQNPRDPAIALVERLQREFPKADIELVTQSDWPGAGNRKVANLAGMLPAARYEILVMADADIRVGADYLATVVGALGQPGVGLVTCLYRGRPARGFWSRLAALQIDHGFLPQAIMGEVAGIGEGCFGATIALRRATLDAAGGFAAIADRLADDYALGEAVRRLGVRVFLAPYLVDTVVAEPTLAALLLQERRWALTIRTIAPMGFLGTFVTHPLALGILANLLSGFHTSAMAMLTCTVICRLVSARIIDAQLGLPRSSPWLLPLRDTLSFWVFVTSFLTRTVAWRGQRLRIGPRGHLIPGGR